MCYLFLGISGNSISFLVFIKQRNSKTSKTTTLLICLAVADNLFLASNIFTRLLPTLCTYIYKGEQLSWSIHLRPYATAIASILQTFASYMVLIVTLQRYVMVTKPINYMSVLSNRRINSILLATGLFSIGFNFIRFYELHVVTKM